MQSLIILGRQPTLGLAELETLYGAEYISRINDNVVCLDVEPVVIDFSRLGGSIKLAQVLTYLDTTNWNEIIKHLSEKLPEFAQNVPEGKIKLGLSVIDLQINTHEINKSALQLKKVIKNTGRSVRVVPNTSLMLNSAQILHNGLTSPAGIELVLVRSGSQTIVAQTVCEQDIEAYARRDQARPKRDAKVGMLPPKLAQIIINLSVGQTKPTTILDPFCGTGVLLQEAMLMGYNSFGTDIEPRMIEYSKGNLDWLKTQYPNMQTDYKLEIADAINYAWKTDFEVIACETYLGRPLVTIPEPSTLSKIIMDCDFIHKKFLKNIAGQIKSGTSLCLAVPAWNTRPNSKAIHASTRQGTDEQRNELYSRYSERVAESGTQYSSASSRSMTSSASQQATTLDNFKHLPILDHLEELGYTRMSFVHTSNQDLIYYRDNQVVGRELVKLIRK